ncbi:MAG TPA: haloacid dehalogenase-like hydrolase [Pseudonocardiaceae bacterium]|nr:haloacid dehalogenase-like hydrolase [Pseudonocardiaceae bacterium]
MPRSSPVLRLCELAPLAGRLVAVASAGSFPAPRVLVLWDIDHTLIETRGVGFTIYQRAFPAATGRPLGKLAQISGRTELGIMRETLRVNGIEPTGESVTKLATALIDGYERAREELAATGRALPGATAALERLATAPQVYQGVLTGNLRDVARIKLEIFGLDTRLDLEASAYGDDHSERPELVAIAQARASGRTGTLFDNQHTVLIGDTPQDIEAGLTAGVRVIAVASGKTNLEQLRTAGATITVNDLTDSEHIAQLITHIATE